MVSSSAVNRFEHKNLSGSRPFFFHYFRLVFCNCNDAFWGGNFDYALLSTS